MPAGFIIYNDDGTVLIDETFACQAITQDGTVVAPLPGARGPDGPGGGTLPATVGRFAHASASFTDIHAGRASPPAPAFYYTEFAVPLRWFNFGDPQAIASSGGLQVFDASGKLTFDSRFKYARVVDVFSGVTSKTYPSGRTYAVMPLGRARRKYYLTEPAGLGSVWVTEEMQSVVSRVEGNVVHTDWRATWLFEHPAPEDPMTVPSGWEMPHTNASFAVIDVTGY